MKLKSIKPNIPTLGIAIAFIFGAGCSTIQAANLSGSLQVAGKPVAGANVTLYGAGTGASAKLAEGKTDNQGAFKLNAGSTSKDNVLCVVAEGPKEDVAMLFKGGSIQMLTDVAIDPAASGIRMMPLALLIKKCSQ